MAPFLPRVRHRSDNDTKAQAEIDQATKSLKAKPDNIFPEDDRGLVSRADDEDGVIEVISDGTQEGLEEGFAAEAAAVTAAAPRPVYSPLGSTERQGRAARSIGRCVHLVTPSRDRLRDGPQGEAQVVALLHAPRRVRVEPPEVVRDAAGYWIWHDPAR